MLWMHVKSLGTKTHYELSFKPDMFDYDLNAVNVAYKFCTNCKSRLVNSIKWYDDVFHMENI